MPRIPDTMTAIEITTPGGPEVLKPATRTVPEYGPTEVLVRVHAAGVNRPDAMQRTGNYPPPPGAPDIPGLEIAGEVIARGASATRFAIGDEVTALVPGGGYAEFCKVAEVNALPIPKGFSLVEAAAIPETYFTVGPNMFERGRLQAGETVLVHGGSSGIGTTAILLAKAFGAKVIVTAGSPEKCAACIRLGADGAIDYRGEDFVTRARELTGGRGPDVILDIIGGDYVQRNYDAAAEDGRIVQIALQKGARTEIKLLTIMTKRLTHTGSTLRPRPIAFKAKVAEALYKNVWPLFEARKIAPVIDSTFPLSEASMAHARLESSAHIGKIVLTLSV